MKSFAEDINLMKKLYFEEKKTLMQVAQIIGCSNKTVESHLKKLGPIRSKSESLRGRKVSEKVKETARKLGKSQVGPKNPTWKGKINRNGYIAIRKTDHPFAASDGYVMEHRLVMENILGRFLTKDEDVHHINGNKKDNRPENLKVLTKSEHGKLHGLEKIMNGTHNNYIKITKEQIEQSVKSGGTVKEMAERIGLERTTFYRKLKQLGIENEYKIWRNYK